MKKLKTVMTSLSLLTFPTAYTMFIRTTSGTQAQKIYTHMAPTPLPSRILLAMTQRRSIIKSHEFKHLYTPLTEQAKQISPVHGAAFAESGTLDKIWRSEKNDDLIKPLVKMLFDKQEDQLKPSELMSSPAYSLTPPIQGLVMGALATEKLSNQETKKNIIKRWRTEHKTMTQGDKISDIKVNNLLNLIETTYTENSLTARAVLLSFLYLKAKSKQDMLRYLTSLEEHIPVFKNDPYYDYEKLMNDNYTEQNYIFFLTKYSNSYGIFPTKNYYEEIISTIIYQKNFTSAYPPQVIMSSYGFQGKDIRPNCMEAAFQDLFNILLYCPTTQSFSFSSLPSSLQYAESFKQFYKEYSSVETINTEKAGQAWMDLVSALPHVMYGQKNNELKASHTHHNFLILFNYLLGMNAQHIDEIGPVLSTKERKITCTFEKGDQIEYNKIIITCHNTTNQMVQKMNVCFKDMHGFLHVPDRTEKNQLNLKTQHSLAYLYNTLQEAQSLFHLQIFSTDDAYTTLCTTHITNPYIYYAFNEKDPVRVLSLISTIVHNHKNNLSCY